LAAFLQEFAAGDEEFSLLGIESNAPLRPGGTP